MSSANNSEDTIDSKRNENNVKTNDFKIFAKQFAKQFLVTICLGIVVFGATGLYTAKVAQSNILPSNVDFAPYTKFDYDIKNLDNISNPITILMNIIKIRSWKGFNFWDTPLETYSQKASFIKEDFKDSFLFKFLCFLETNSQKDGTFSNLSYFMHNIFKTNIANSFSIITTIYSLLYKLPEWLVMLLYFTVFPFITIFLLFYNGIMALITNLGNTNAAFDEFMCNQTGSTMDSTCEINEKIWKNVSLWDGQRGWFNFAWTIMVFFVYLYLSFFMTIFMAFFTTFYSLISPLFREYKLEGSDNKETYGFGTFLKDTFFYKKSFIMMVTAYTLLDSVYKYLNNVNYVTGCIIAIIILAVGVGIFNPSSPENVDATQIKISNINDLTKVINVKQERNGIEIDCKKTTSETEQNGPAESMNGLTNEQIMLNNIDNPQNTGYIGGEKIGNGQNPYKPAEFNNLSEVENLKIIKGGKKKLKLNNDGTCHKKYNVKLA
jgi:hypothetical protein